jgi:hypothetical protein
MQTGNISQPLSHRDCYHLRQSDKARTEVESEQIPDPLHFCRSQLNLAHDIPSHDFGKASSHSVAVKHQVETLDRPMQ